MVKPEKKLISSIKVYPNPTSGKVNIQVLKSKDKYKVVVFDLYGKKILEEVYHGDAQQILLNINSAKGLYFLKISNSSVNITEKIIIQ